MSFKLYGPGERKGNKDYVARFNGTYNGVPHPEKVLTGCKTRREADVRAMELELEMLAEQVPDAKEDITFRKAAELYVAQRDPVLDLVDIKANLGARNREEAGRIARLIATDLGAMPVRNIKHTDLVAAANKLYGSKKAATKNREAMRPAAAILHYASENGYCGWLRVTVFEEPKPKTRAVTMDLAAQLIGAAPEGMQRLFLLWIFRQGTRISQTLTVTWNDIDLQQQVFTFYNKKANEQHEMPLDPEVFEALAAIPEAERHGRLWPWTQKTGVYRWLRPLTKELHVRFTPHMARHTLGKSLNANGAGLRTIMSALGHLDPKSSMRYQSADIETVRAAMAAIKLPKVS